jgi:hypothetical protein
MMGKLAVLLGLVAVCVAQESSSAASPLRYSPQDKFLANKAVGNFACRVDTVEVTLDKAGDEDKMVVSTEDLEADLSQTATLEWAHVNQFFFSSLDGRNDEKILGAAGGDIGEFIHGIEAYSRVTGAELTAEDVDALLARLLKIMSRSKFFFETDDKAYRKLAIATGCQNMHIASLGDKRKKQAILDIFAGSDMADYIGDPYIKWMAQNPEASGVRTKYITYAIQAFHTNMWRNNIEASTICYLSVKGRVDPKAIIHVKTPGYCIDQGLAPLISSQICAGQTFIEHTDAVKLYRRELVNLFAKPADPPQDILAQFNTIGTTSLEAFWDTFVGLPSFTVTFKNSRAQTLGSEPTV